MADKFYDIANVIDGLVREYSPERLEEIERLFRAKGVEHYFFRQKLPEVDESSAWLIPLMKKGYFSGEKNPPPQEAKDQPGFYTIPYWNVLGYLEEVSKKNKEAPSDEITEALLEIADGIMSYRDEKGERIDNYRTDWVMQRSGPRGISILSGKR